MKDLTDGLTSFEKIQEQDRIMSILEKYKDRNFVQRILAPDKYPEIKNPDGSVSSHLMSWDSLGDSGKAIVYPLIIQDQEGKSLRKLSPDEAYDHAMKTKEYIQFDSGDEADWFSRNYKKVWEQ